MMNLKSEFLSHLRRQYPDLNGKEFPDELIADQLFSPFTLKLPRAVLGKIEDAVRSVHQLREKLRPRLTNDPGYASTMMSLDFHLDESRDLKLIEINTNASFLILGWELYRVRGLTAPADFGPSRWKEDLLESLRESGRTMPSPRVHIIDTRPAEQRLYAEFLVAREWLRGFGWAAEIRDVPEALKDPKPDLIYNRSTDFYLETPESQALKEAFAKNEVCLTPNPFEYELLADKQRLIEWSRPGFLEGLGLSTAAVQILRGLLSASEEMTAEHREDIWARRKNLFFKPKREFGSKKAFKGASVSRKVFDQLFDGTMLAQGYVAAPEAVFETPEGPQSFKFDLRCHFYKDRLEGVIARLYQGQVTNLKTTYGGFVPVVFE